MFNLRTVKPHVTILSFETSLRRLFSEFMRLEGYVVGVAKTSEEVLTLLEREQGPALVLTDNFVFNEEAQRLVLALQQRPALRVRVKIVGADIMSGGMGSPTAILYDLDAHILLPASIDSLLTTLEELWINLLQEQPSMN